MKRIVVWMAAAVTAGWMSCAGQPAGGGAGANMSPNLQEVIKLTQAHMGDDVIIAYIRNSGATYSLSADDILYLNGQGVSQPVLAELLHTRANAPAPVQPMAPPSPAPLAQPGSPAPARRGGAGPTASQLGREPGVFSDAIVAGGGVGGCAGLRAVLAADGDGAKPGVAALLRRGALGLHG